VPLFKYRALAADGKKVSGVIDADSFTSAKERLRRDQVMVVDLSLIDQAQKKLQLEPSLVLAFTRELTQLLRAGLPLYESLLTIEEKYRKHPSHPVFLDLCDRLKGGSSLSAALRHYPESFDAVYLSMVHAAEQSASLTTVFEQISSLLSKQQKLKKQLISAMTYPAFLGAFCFLVILSLLFFVIPSIQELFEGRRLHPLTEIVLSVSKFMNQYAFVLLGVILAIGSSAYVLLKKPATK
jgi:general secretion pathway protein F